MPPKTTHSIRQNLLLVVLAGVLPVLAVIIYSGLERRDNELSHASMTALRLARYYAGQQEREVRRIRTVLARLAQTTELKSLDLPACTVLFKTFLQANPNYANFALMDADGNAIASALPFKKQNLANRKEIRDVMAGAEFSVGEYAVGRGEQGPHTALRPLCARRRRPADGRRPWPPCACRNSPPCSGRRSLPEESFVGITDHKGSRLYRYPEKPGISHRRAHHPHCLGPHPDGGARRGVHRKGGPTGYGGSTP